MDHISRENHLGLPVSGLRWKDFLIGWDLQFKPGKPRPFPGRDGKIIFVLEDGIHAQGSLRPAGEYLTALSSSPAPAEYLQPHSQCRRVRACKLGAGRRGRRSTPGAPTK